jgi:hypothetical protein
MVFFFLFPFFLRSFDIKKGSFHARFPSLFLLGSTLDALRTSTARAPAADADFCAAEAAEYSPATALAAVANDECSVLFRSELAASSAPRRRLLEEPMIDGEGGKPERERERAERESR